MLRADCCGQLDKVVEIGRGVGRYIEVYSLSSDDFCCVPKSDG